MFYAAWYSNRDGLDRIYLKSSADGRTWSEDVAITSPADHAFYPTLAQSADGRFHLVAWHGRVGDGGKIVGRIAYSSSNDAKTWSPPSYLTPDSPSALAWAPTIVARSASDLLVAWSSDETGDKDIYVATSANGGASWSAPKIVMTNAFHDDLPFVARKPDGTLFLAWQRYDKDVTAFDAPFNAASNDLVYATSPDGASWRSPIPITNDGVVPDITPSLFPSADATGFTVAWASVRGTSKTGDISMLGLSAVPATATNVRQLTDAPGGDYSARLIPAGRGGLYMMAWVSNRSPLTDGGENLDVWYQLLRLP